MNFYQDCTLKHTDPAGVDLRNAVEPLMFGNQTAGPDSTALERTHDDVRFYRRELNAADSPSSAGYLTENSARGPGVHGGGASDTSCSRPRRRGGRPHAPYTPRVDRIPVMESAGPGEACGVFGIYAPA